MPERHVHVTPAEVTERLAARMARRSVLDRDSPPTLWVLLDENVLRREIGNAKITSEQLRHPAAVAARPKVTVQLLPGTGAHVGLQGAMTMAETPEACVVNLDDFTDGRTTDSPVTVAQASERFDSLRSEAYRASESLAMIERGRNLDTIDSPWRKSSYSGTSGGSCVETASGAGVILVRDTTDREGFTLSVPADAWARFTDSLR